MTESTAAGSTDQPFRHRDLAESFGAEAERYDRTRPRYPAQVAEQILAASPGRRVLDVGIGTGISALPFRDAGAEVLGIEVDAEMARLARARGFEVEVAKFEEWDPAGRRLDAVVAGQTWHWIDPDAGLAKAADVLVDGGRWAVFWNIGDPDPDVARAAAEVYRLIDTGLPFNPYERPALSAYEGFLTRTEDTMRAHGGFGPLERWRQDWAQTLTRDEYIDLVPTLGGHSRIAPERLRELLDGLGRVVDDAGGSVTMHYATVTVTAVRRRRAEPADRR